MSKKRTFKDFSMMSLPVEVRSIWYSRDREFNEIPSAPLRETSSIEDQIHAKLLIEKIAPKIEKRLWNFFYKRHVLGIMASEMAKEEGLSAGYVQTQINRAGRKLMKAEYKL